jgi:anti-sigma factor RsiW
MITCRELLDFILDYVEGELPEAQRAEFERHMAACPPCVAYLDSYRKTAEIVRELAECDEQLVAGAPEPLIAAILAARNRR